MVTVRQRIDVLRKHPVVDLAVTIVLAIVIAYGVQRWIVRPFKIPSESMVPTLRVSDRLLVARFVYRFRDPERGDIVVFYPNGKGGGTPFATDRGPTTVTQDDGTTVTVPKDSHASTPFVKRIIGLPGEIVGATGGHVYICTRTEPDFTRPVSATAGCRVLVEPYVSSRQATFGPTRIPADHYFMMGDNRNNSEDSRYWGTVLRSHIIGPAFARYWPLTRIGPV